MLLHPRIQTILTDMAKSDRIGHGLILSGGLGSFAKNAALYLVEAAGCRPGPDLIVFEEDTKIAVQLIRDLQEQIRFGPRVSSRLFVVFCATSQFSTEAANAFLKTLESPPDGVHFILISQNSSSILPTIRSRCQILECPTLSLEVLLSHVSADIAEKNLHNPVLISHALESEQSLDNAVSYAQFCQMSILEKLRVAADFSKSKPDAILLLTSWLWEMGTAYPSQLQEAIIRSLDDMKFNVSLRLHLESLFLEIS